MDMTEPLANRRREHFPSLSSGIHLLSHSLGPVPKGARDAMIAYTDAWEHHTSEDAWATKWWEMSAQVGDRFAAIIGGTPGSVQVLPNASIALSTVASCFDYSNENRNTVVTTALDFPTTGYIWQGQTRLGAKLKVVPSCDGISTPLESILDAIDENTLLVALSHTSFRSSYRVNAEAIVDKAHSVGALVLFDVYQSAGIVRLQATRWDVDFMIGGTIKWLCGGPACGYLYVRPELQKTLRPRLTGWVAHQRPFDFAAEMEYAESVGRFAQGTPTIPGLHSCLAGLDIVEDVGLSAIVSESRRRTTRMVEFATEHGWSLNTPMPVDNRGGSVMVRVDNPPQRAAQLAERKVFVDYRPGILRMSPHFFNTDDEVEEALNVLAEIL